MAEFLNDQQSETLREHPSQESATKRLTVAAIDDILYHPFPVLNHGFIRVIDYMGGDSAIVQAARVSYGQGTKHVSQDRGLIHYLMRHYHSTPFEMCEIKLHVKLPIFVARHWIRHRTANVNEYSARYSILGKDYYVPDAAHIGPQSAINNQGRGEAVSGEKAAMVQDRIHKESLRSYEAYETLLNQGADAQEPDNEELGVARELARTILPVNYYTEWYWKTDLHNLLHFFVFTW